MNASVKDTEIKKFLIKTWITVDTSFSCRDINPGVRGVCDNAALSADIIDPFMWLFHKDITIVTQMVLRNWFGDCW